jgi:hypothetical protein
MPTQAQCQHKHNAMEYGFCGRTSLPIENLGLRGWVRIRCVECNACLAFSSTGALKKKRCDCHRNHVMIRNYHEHYLIEWGHRGEDILRIAWVRLTCRHCRGVVEHRESIPLSRILAVVREKKNRKNTSTALDSN